MCWLIWTLHAFLPLTGKNTGWPQTLEWDRDSFWAIFCFYIHYMKEFVCLLVCLFEKHLFRKPNDEKAVGNKPSEWVYSNTRFLVKLLQWHSKLYLIWLFLLWDTEAVKSCAVGKAFALPVESFIQTSGTLQVISVSENIWDAACLLSPAV